jgi:AcrR family transcriptional regulator
MQEVGYDHLRVVDVAARAGVGIATVYRRFPTKRDLVLETLRSHDPLRLPAATDDPRADLVAILRQMVALVAGDGAHMLTGFLAALRDDPEMAEAFREEAMGRARAALASAIARVVPDAHDAGLRADAVLGYLLFQSLITGEDLDLDRTPEQLLAFVSGAAGVARPAGGGAGSAS